MLKICCPFCGPRNEVEFVHGGQVKERRPENASQTDDESWVEYLTVPKNPVGPIDEHWWHIRGCGCWITVTRDTTSHEILDGEAES